MLSDLIGAYNTAVFETDKDSALKVIDLALAGGATPEEIVTELVIPAVDEMMTMVVDDPDSNLAQQFMIAQIASEVTEKLLALFRSPPEPAGHAVIGTARGDLHTLGKRIVIGCLKTMMVDVVDLGGNVPAERFVDEAERVGAQVIGISAMMVHTATGPEGCLKVRRILHERGLEDRIKIVVGGAPYRFDSELYKSVGADGWAPDGMRAGRLILDIIKQVKTASAPKSPVMEEKAR
jgi:trimethylamine corrinoid protein